MITQARLKEVLHYDPETGFFFWKMRTANCVQIGRQAGGYNIEGYRRVVIDGKTYLQHRLAWLYVYNQLPDRLDHKNQDRSDNRISNLREATHSQNLFNSKLSKNNTTGFNGVYKEHGKWRARIGRKAKHLGYFDTPEAADAAYREALQKMHGAFFEGDMK